MNYYDIDFLITYPEDNQSEHTFSSPGDALVLILRIFVVTYLN